MPTSVLAPFPHPPGPAPVDPWSFYRGNIAEACRATNHAVTEHHQEKEESGGSGEEAEKKRQRANSRLTAWQSRERKRIEFEVLQERQAELQGRNADLRTANEKISTVIERLKAAKRHGHDIRSILALSALPRPFGSILGGNTVGDTSNLHSSVASSMLMPRSIPDNPGISPLATSSMMQPSMAASQQVAELTRQLTRIQQAAGSLLFMQPGSNAPSIFGIGQMGPSSSTAFTGVLGANRHLQDFNLAAGNGSGAAQDLLLMQQSIAAASLQQLQAANNAEGASCDGTFTPGTRQQEQLHHHRGASGGRGGAGAFVLNQSQNGLGQSPTSPNLSTFLTSPLEDHRVDVPLVRAVSKQAQRSGNKRKTGDDPDHSERSGASSKAQRQDPG